MTSLPPRRPLLPFLVLVASIILAAACTGERAHDAGFLQAPGFTDENGRLERPWRFAHHASKDSYRLDLDQGVASIERTGPEPWSALMQQIDSDRLAEIAGRRMAFSVDISARLDDSEYGRPFEPTGLMVRTWTRPAGGESSLSAMLGSRQNTVERLELDADAQIPAWTRHSIEFDVPADVTRMEVGIVMSTGGVLAMRGPALRVVDQ